MTVRGRSIGTIGGGAAVLALAACAVPPATDALASVPGYAGALDGQGALVVTREATPFANFEGAAAKRAANAMCGGAVASSIDDTYRDGAWVFPKGCA
ncbi:hypothetical protein [Thioclava sp.]|uniref:hypothetical protein n=1 Tax=Thioclava sp. TaxID=1933450 RepID=UPI003AA91581